ncbi:MAG: hypothetical protein AB7V08_03215 [Elusimicrobiales bacterium]
MRTIFKSVVRSEEFDRDLKKLLRRFRSLEEDLSTLVRTQLNIYHKLHVDNGGIFRLTGLPFEVPQIFKVKKFACKALKGRGVKSGIRVVYAYYEETDSVELVEIYFKADQQNEDRQRLLKRYSAR